MSDENDFFDDVIGEDLDLDEMTDEQDEEDDDDEPVDVRTVLMMKNEMVALLGLKTSARGGLIIRVDPRESRPAAQTYDDATQALKWFNRSLASSKRNGWDVLYDGEPLYG